MKGSPLKTVNMIPPDGLFGSQQRGDDNSESPDKSSQHATCKDSQFGIHTNQYHPQQGYGYPPSRQPFQALRSFITGLHSTWHIVCNLPVAQAMNIKVMGHRGKDETCTKVVMVGLKCSPIRSSQGNGRPLQMHRECLQDHREIIQSISEHLRAWLLLHNLHLTYLGDTALASRRKDSSYQWNRRKQMSQGLQTCPHCRRCPMTNIMQLMRLMIRRIWAVQKAIPQSAWSKRSYPWSNLPKGWGSPTLVHSTSGRKYGWRGFSRRSIGPLSGGITDWNKMEMDPCTGRQRSQIFWQHSKGGCQW